MNYLCKSGRVPLVITSLLLCVCCILPIWSEDRLLGSGSCNITIEGRDYIDGYYPPTPLHPPPVSREMVGQPLYCAYVFRGVEGQRVQLHVRRLVTGRYEPRLKRCVDGFLKLWDGMRVPGRYPYPPNTLCGAYDQQGDLSVKKFSSGTRAEMEYFVEAADPRSTFDITYKFVNVETERGYFPKQINHDMKLATSAASVCNWKVVLEDCRGHCAVLSPGYPGTYPPFMECYYHVLSEDPYVSVQIKFFGSESKPREFEIAYSADCRDEYLEIYDGNSTEDKGALIGRFCGADIPDVTTSGGHALLVFVSRGDAPPYGNNGFHATAYALTKEWHLDGIRVPNTHCDWSFNASRGSVSSPDYWLPKRSSCTYIFKVQKGYYLEVILNLYGLKPDCKEQINVYEGSTLLARICKNNLKDELDTFTFNLTAPEVIIRYITDAGQMQGHPELGFWISFQEMLEPEVEEMKDESKPQQDESAQKVVDYEHAQPKGSASCAGFTNLNGFMSLLLLGSTHTLLHRWR